VLLALFLAPRDRKLAVGQRARDTANILL